MHSIVVESVAAFEIPDLAWRTEAALRPNATGLHQELRLASPSLQTVRIAQTDHQSATGGSVRVAAWNLERCKFVEESAWRLRESGIDIALITEADIGMARSGNRDTVAELAGLLAMGEATGVEFIELGLGDAREISENKDKTNSSGLHCNSVLSRFPIDRAAVLRLDDSGTWFHGKVGKGQRRIGGRIAVAARIRIPWKLWVFSVHFESEGGPWDRAREAETLVDGIYELCGDAPAVVGGDFNFNAVPVEKNPSDGGIRLPEDVEPAFNVFERAGFDWRSSNAPGATTRRHPWQSDYREMKIDWIFERGLISKNPEIVLATGRDGANLSDHELLHVDISKVRERTAAA